MTHPTKIATCSYCGTRTAFVLAGQTAHKLTCSACGAPLDQMEMVSAATLQGQAAAGTLAVVPPPAARRSSAQSDKSPSAEKRTGGVFGVGLAWIDERSGAASSQNDDDDDDDDDPKDRKSKGSKSSGKKSKKKKRRKSLAQRLLDDAADAIEDIFD
jgi:hypothetical protein